MAFALCLLVACGGKDEDKPTPKNTGGGNVTTDGTTPTAPTTKTDTPTKTDAPVAPTGPLKSDVGVDVAKKVIRIGALNDESGPAAAIGKPFAVGKRLVAEVVNSGATNLLPKGWTVALVEKDHGYNPQKSVQAYKAIKEDVLFIGTSFGTPNTLPLMSKLERDGIVAFPASLSSKMAANRYTPPLGPSYEVEAHRAMDWVIKSAGGAANVKAGIVYQQDDYGLDGKRGWEAAAKHHGVEIVASQTVSPSQKSLTGVVAGLKAKGATHILVTVLPGTTGPLLGTAAKMKYMPVWIGNTPAWIDVFFSPKVIPPAVFTNFYLMSGMPYWGEDVPGMKEFIESAGKETKPNSYILLSYVQGLIQLEAAKRAIENRDITRAGYLKALSSIKKWDAGGMLQSINLSDVPYSTGTRTRVLKPVMDKATWKVVAPFATPSSMK